MNLKTLKNIKYYISAPHIGFCENDPYRNQLSLLIAV